MFILDDLLLAPLRGALWTAQHVAEEANRRLAMREEAIVESLARLHRDLEAGRIEESEFDAREASLLDRLDAVRGQAPEAEGPSEDRGGAG